VRAFLEVSQTALEVPRLRRRRPRHPRRKPATLRRPNDGSRRPPHAPARAICERGPSTAPRGLRRVGVCGTRAPAQTLFESLQDDLALDQILERLLTVRREEAIAVLEQSKSEWLVSR
jgi:hypothetical protein